MCRFTHQWSFYGSLEGTFRMLTLTGDFFLNGSNRLITSVESLFYTYLHRKLVLLQSMRKCIMDIKKACIKKLTYPERVNGHIKSAAQRPSTLHRARAFFHCTLTFPKVSIAGLNTVQCQGGASTIWGTVLALIKCHITPVLSLFFLSIVLAPLSLSHPLSLLSYPFGLVLAKISLAPVLKLVSVLRIFC